VTGEQLKQLDEDDEPDDAYHGNEGWVVVAVGARGRACYLDIDYAFGALRFFVSESGLDDPSDADLMPDGDEGVYRCMARAYSQRLPEGETDIGFTRLSPWEETTWPLPTSP
jgi:hypothetical protein